MKAFFKELKKRNRILYYFGLINLMGVFSCLVIMQFDHTQVMNINAWIKPMKFFLSIAIYSWTMGWLLHYLNEPRKIKYFNYMVLIVLIFEQTYVCIQAAKGQKSHFNFSSPTAITLYSLMGIAITVMVIWTAYFGFMFYRRSFPQLLPSYVWGIRFGITFFVLFSLAAHVMASSSGHTVGAPDGGAGLPFTNWSTRYGDLRVAHFVGMHALQVLPLFGYYISKNTKTTVAVSIIYFIVTSAVFVQALMGKPLINF